MTFVSLESAMGFSQYAFQYRQILDMADNDDGVYKYSTVSNSGASSYRNIYTIKPTDNGIEFTHEMTGKGVEEENTIEITGINDTEFTIPAEVYSMEVTEK